ncbi:MAG: hypothetical protein ACE5DO_07025 [Desulfobacterales bacterium]
MENQDSYTAKRHRKDTKKNRSNNTKKHRSRLRKAKRGKPSKQSVFCDSKKDQNRQGKCEQDVNGEHSGEKSLRNGEVSGVLDIDFVNADKQ